ncbi:Gfo/Idh/MocA family oxidoreductase [Microbacterium sp.]|uniref:Gfo/Idh/MocA family protein n=1 Tax=Microbacterium sp. TaxID=51671 RepID=UPI00333FE99A
MTLRLGAVGAGSRSRLLAYLPEGEARVAAVADVTENGRERAAAAFPSAAIVGSHRDLEGLALDGVFVLTPDHTHAEIAIDLLRSGIPVYLEKPMATTTEDCDAILRTAYETGTKLYVGHNMRHMPFVEIMHDLIAEGAIGEVRTIWCRHFVGHGGDFYFKDWHAERAKGTGLLLQKGSHDIDVIHYLAGASSREITAMGDLMVYDRVTDRRDNSDRLMGTLASYENWPPLAQTELNPVIDVEDVSMMLMRLGNGVLASYEQCHFTPDYWRNYTVIGTEGRLENLGDDGVGVVRLWNRRSEYRAEGDRDVTIPSGEGTHGGADVAILAEFLRFIRDGGATTTSPVAARDSVAAAIAATGSLRDGSMPRRVAPVEDELATYFSRGQRRLSPGEGRP